MSVRGRFSIASLYYYVTPVFVLLDYGWGISVRAAVLDSAPLYKNLYYGFCILCGVGVSWCRGHLARDSRAGRPRHVLSADLPAVAGFDAPRIVNLMLAGAIAAVGFHGSLHAMEQAKHRDIESDQFL